MYLVIGQNVFDLTKRIFNPYTKALELSLADPVAAMFSIAGQKRALCLSPYFWIPGMQNTTVLIEVQLLPTSLILVRSSNPLGEEQRHVGPLVALSNTLANLSRLKVLDISHCCLIGLAGHRYHGLNALGNAFSRAKNSLTHLRCSFVSCSNLLSVCTLSDLVADFLPFASTRQHNIFVFVLLEPFYKAVTRGSVRGSHGRGLTKKGSLPVVCAGLLLASITGADICACVFEPNVWHARVSAKCALSSSLL